MSPVRTIATLLVCVLITTCISHARADEEKLPVGVLRRIGSTRLRHLGQVTTLAFSPDGKHVLSGGSDGIVKLWNVASGCEIRRLQFPESNVVAVVFSPNGKRVLVGFCLDKCESFLICLIDIASGQELARYPVAKRRISHTALRFLSDDNSFIFRFDHSIHLWNADGKRRNLSEKMDVYHPLAMSPNGRHLAMRASNRIVLGEITTSNINLHSEFFLTSKLETSSTKPTDPLRPHIAITSDGQLVLESNEHGEVRVWNIGKNQFHHPFKSRLTTDTSDFVISPDGKSVAWNETYSEVQLYDIASGRLIQRFGDHRLGVGAIAFSSDEKLLATASGQTIRLWDIASGRELHPTTYSQMPVDFVALSKDGSTLVFGGDTTVSIWNAQTGQLRKRFGNCVARFFNTASNTLLTEPYEREPNTPGHNCWSITKDEIRMLPSRERHWAETERVLKDLETHITKRTTVPDLIPHYLRSLQSHKVVGELQHTGNGWRRVLKPCSFIALREAISPDGNLVALSTQFSGYGTQEQLSLWEIRSGKPRELGYLRYQEDKPIIPCLCFSPDSTRLVAGWTSGRIEVWDAKTGKALLPLKAHKGKVYALAFSPDGLTFASGGADGVVRIWETATGRLCRELRGHEGPVKSVCYGNSGRIVVSGGADTTVVLWRISGEE